MDEQKPAELGLANAKLTQCPTSGTPYLIGDNYVIRKRIIVKARCKQWDCPYCSLINKSEHMNRIAVGIDKLIRQGLPLQFVTITCHEKWRGYENSLRNWRSNKDKLLARYRRYTKKQGYGTGDYVYIPECHTDGSIHIHGVFVGKAKTRWWKDNARQSGLGYMAESEQLTSALQAINYVLKYITKEVGRKSIIKGFRRINYSQGFPHVYRLPSGFEWDLLASTESIESAIISGLVKEGLTVKFDGVVFKTTDDLS